MARGARESAKRRAISFIGGKEVSSTDPLATMYCSKHQWKFLPGRTCPKCDADTLPSKTELIAQLRAKLVNARYPDYDGGWDGALEAAIELAQRLPDETLEQAFHAEPQRTTIDDALRCIASPIETAPISNLRVYPDWMMLGAEGVLDLIESDFGQSGRDVQLEAIRCQLWDAYVRGLRQPVETSGSSFQAPIVKITVGENYLIERSDMYAPGLPPGEHELYCEPPAPGGEKVPHPAFETSEVALTGDASVDMANYLNTPKGKAHFAAMFPEKTRDVHDSNVKRFTESE